MSEANQLLQAKQLEVNSLLEITQAINSNLPSDNLFKIFEFILRGQIGLEKLMLLMHQDDTWKQMASYGTETIFQVNEHIEDLSNYKEITDISDIDNGILNEFNSIIPVQHKGKAIAIVLAGQLRDTLLTDQPGKMKFIQTITNIIIVAIENKHLFKKQLEQEALKKEMELAAKMQLMLIPKTLPQNNNVEMSALYLPHHNVGGDYYDVIVLDENRIAFCVADIAGKGVSAALLMANFQAAMRILTRQNLALTDIVPQLNSCVLEITQGDRFITLFLAIYNYQTRKLNYINAGHNPPALYRKKDQTISLLEKGSTLLGVFDELPSIEMDTLDIGSGDILISFTDGVTELENEDGVQFEMERTEAFIKKHAKLDMSEFTDTLMDTLKAYKGTKPFDDDVTLLSIRYL